MLFAKFENKQIIKGTLTAIDPIHIGAASKDDLDPIEPDNAVLKDSMGEPLIPGSSLKGVVRSRFEALLSAAGKRVCNIYDEHDANCVSKEKAEEIKSRDLNGQEKAQLIYDTSCEVCRLFGGRQIAGKLQFKDCYYIGDKPCKYEKRDGVGIDRKTGAAKRGAKYDFEIIPKGTKFGFELIAENLDEKQEKYLDIILNMLCGKGITDEDHISVGGKTTRGLGRIRLDIDSRSRTDAEDIRRRITEFTEGIGEVERS